MQCKSLLAVHVIHIFAFFITKLRSVPHLDKLYTIVLELRVFPHRILAKALEAVMGVMEE